MVKRRLWLVLGLASVLLVGVTGVVGVRLTPYLRDRLERALANQLESQVSLSTLRVTWMPQLGVTGEGLVVRHRGRTDVRPLIELRSFSADASIAGLLARPMRLATVRVTGLRIHIPPHRDTDAPRSDNGDSRKTDLTIDRVIAEDAELVILPKAADKDPKVFQIHHLQLHAVGLREHATFEATLTNPLPRGEISATGTIGPWGRDEPGDTPVSGHYTFTHADLGTIHGIGGILDSIGTFTGRLNRIEVMGETRTPDFRIAKTGAPVPLQAKFHAIVDGMNGDTILQRIDATLEKSPMVCTGSIIDIKNRHGHDIKVHAVMDAGRIEDLLRLAVRADQPLMTGAVSLQADLEIPPGEAAVIDKLRLQGRVGVHQTRFSPAVQERIDTLSQRTRGHTEGPAESVVSNLRGGFVLRQGVLRFSSLDFDVPGAALHLEGTYGLRDERFDLKGTVTMQAKLSATVTGYKSFLLKLFDPLFSRHRTGAGAVIPVRVTGTRQSPNLGLDVKRALKGGD